MGAVSHDALIRLVAGYLPERLVFITDADLVLLDDDLQVRRVMVGGAWL